jgi:hypothetical protein
VKEGLVSICRNRPKPALGKTRQAVSPHWHETCLLRLAQIRLIQGVRAMMDIFFLIVVVGFFAGAIAYVEGCERL